MTESRPIMFSDKNHWRFGWGAGIYNFNEWDKPLWISFGSCRYEPKTVDVEAAAAARKIADNATKPLYVAMSGGIDSEIVARMMLQEKIPFTPLIAQFEHDYNKLDITYAFDFCRKHALEPEIVKLDIIPFFESCLNTPYIVTNCAHLMQMHLMRHAAGLGGMAIMGVGEQRYIRKKNGKIITKVKSARLAVPHFMHMENIEAVPAFYYYTPELMLSLLRESRQHGFTEIKEHAHNVKEDVYRKFWPDLTPRPKYSGYEAVMGPRLKAQAVLENKYGALVKGFKIPVHKLERQLSPVNGTAINTPPVNEGAGADDSDDDEADA